MKKFLMTVAVFVMSCVFGFFPAVVSADSDAPGEEGPRFSNQDLEKYRSPADSSVVPGTVRAEERNRTAKRDEQKEKTYWCRKASEYQKKIDRAKDEVKDSEKLASDDRNGTTLREHKPGKADRKKYEQAKRQLREAERDLSYLEEEAHRKDVPPGWLRCQFE